LPHAIGLVSDTVIKEMDAVKTALAWSIDTTTPESLLQWDVNAFIGPLVENSAPTIGHLLHTAAQTRHAKEENKIKSCVTACNIIVAQLAKERSQHALYFAIPFTLFLWMNGASRQTLEALHKCGLCISFSSLTSLLHQLASQSLERASQVARGLHALCWDNINIKTSIFVEQRDSAPAKVQSGTFAILYEINADPDDMRLSSMLARAQRASDLTFEGDVRPTVQQWRSFGCQLRIHVINILLKSSKAFKEFQHSNDPRLTHPERWKMPAGSQTKQYSLRTLTIDESSISGNIAVVNDVYINQLKMTDEDLCHQVFLQLGFGLFHLSMNLIWALLHVHRGSIHQVGSLSYFFSILDRTRLGYEHPDYHTLISTLFQILRGVILNAWKVECGHSSLAAFALSNPSVDKLLQVADKIIRLHASPPESHQKSDPGSKSSILLV
ncbi:hypothetical protein OG21DRAFT_1428847, partial [Imleria badia]